MKPATTYIEVLANSRIRSFGAFILFNILFWINSNQLSATTYTSTQSGPSNVAATWGGVGVPLVTDDIVISAGTTVSLVDNWLNPSTTLWSFATSNITVNSGGVLDNTGSSFLSMKPNPFSSFIINGTYTGSKATRWLVGGN